MALMDTEKSIIFYSDSELSEEIAAPVRRQILKAGLPIVSVSLKPLEFGTNFVVEGKRGYVSMMRQIILGLGKATTKYVFFCEHDVLYPKSHFDFTPTRDDIFFYNANVWRWMVGTETAIRHERMLPLSVMCCNRELALNFYQYRMKKMREVGLEKFENSQHELIRKWGFEPGTKKKKRGGLTDDDFETWYSEKAVIDIRHKGTFSPPKYTRESFKHAPKNWEEVSINDI